MSKLIFISSSESPKLTAAIAAKKTGIPKDEIVCLISDKADCGAAKAARTEKIRVYYIDAREISAEVFDEQAKATLDFFKPDQVIVDGFSRPLTDVILSEYSNKIA
jgi:folate-dependent phosphoribosylglycinamide formyltransferase PurN